MTIAKGSILVFTGNAANQEDVLAPPADGSFYKADSTQALGFIAEPVADFAKISNNLSDLASASTARTNLGLGSSATHASTDFLLAANNLSDLASASSARTNLGLGTSSTLAIKAGSATLATGAVTVSDSAVTAGSQILVTAQSNSSLGSLRVTSKTAGVGFIITSTLLTDSGAVAYLIVG